MEFIVYNPDALPTLMLHVLDGLNGRKKVAVYGEMGAGKTTFIRAFCEHFKVKEKPASPTYSLVNEYAYKEFDGKVALIRHIDLYRLRSAREALDIGIEEILDDPWYCLIEWPQLIEPMLPADTAKIYIDITGETTRKVRIV